MKIVAATPPPSQPVSGLKLGIVRLGRAAGKVSEEQRILSGERAGDGEQLSGWTITYRVVDSKQLVVCYGCYKRER